MQVHGTFTPAIERVLRQGGRLWCAVPGDDAYRPKAGSGGTKLITGLVLGLREWGWKPRPPWLPESWLVMCKLPWVVVSWAYSTILVRQDAIRAYQTYAKLTCEAAPESTTPSRWLSALSTHGLTIADRKAQEEAEEAWEAVRLAVSTTPSVRVGLEWGRAKTAEDVRMGWRGERVVWITEQR